MKPSTRDLPGNVTLTAGHGQNMEYNHVVTPREQVLDAMIECWLLDHEYQINAKMVIDWKHDGSLNYGKLQPAFKAIMQREASS